MSEIPKGYKQTEVGVIPEDWETPCLGMLFSFKNGLNKGKEFFGYGVPIVNYMDVYKQSGIVSVNLKGLVNVNSQELESFNVKCGDVFFTRTSETVAEVGIASVLLDESPNTVFSGFILRARPKNNESLNNQFKKYCFSSNTIRNQIISKSTYTTRALTNGRVLSAIILPLPPTKAEQEAIATALSDTDALIQSLEKLIAKKRLIKQGAMQELLTGKRRLPGFKVKSGYKKTEVGVIPEDWKNEALGNHVEIKSGESPSLFHFGNEGTPYFKVEQLNNNSKYLCDTLYFFQEEKKVLFGSIIFPKRGASILLNKIRILKQDAFMDTNLMALTPKVSLDNEYLYYALTHIELWRIADTTSIPQINNKHIIPLVIPFPPKAEQEAIATVLSDMDAEISAMEAKLAKYKQIKQGMMQNLLTGRIRLVK